MSSGEKQKNEPASLIQRGVRGGTSTWTIATFIGLRAADVIIQYKLLQPGGWGSALFAKTGITSIIPGASIDTGIGLIDQFGLPAPQLLLLVLSAGSASKQIFWLSTISNERFPLSSAFVVATFNLVINTVNSLLFLSAATTSVSSPPLPGTSIPYPYVVGPILFLLGIFTEAYSEIQRKSFKNDPRNQGKVCRSGLWSLARHINYGGYTIWRAAYTLASTGIVGGLVSGVVWGLNFAGQAVPELDAYCSKRYGEQWVAFKRDVPWVLIPGIY